MTTEPSVRRGDGKLPAPSAAACAVPSAAPAAAAPRSNATEAGGEQSAVRIVRQLTCGLLVDGADAAPHRRVPFVGAAASAATAAAASSASEAGRQRRRPAASGGAATASSGGWGGGGGGGSGEEGSVVLERGARTLSCDRRSTGRPG